MDEGMSSAGVEQTSVVTLSDSWNLSRDLVAAWLTAAGCSATQAGETPPQPSDAYLTIDHSSLANGDLCLNATIRMAVSAGSEQSTQLQHSGDLENLRALLSTLPTRRRSEWSPPRIELHLTARERSILTAAAEGKSAKETAQMLQVSTRTVDDHRRSLLYKLGAASTAEAVMIAARTGLINTSAPAERQDATAHESVAIIGEHKVLCELMRLAVRSEGFTVQANLQTPSAVVVVILNSRARLEHDASWPSPAVVVSHGKPHEGELLELCRRGAHAVIDLEGDSLSALTSAITRVLDGDSLIPARVLRQLLNERSGQATNTTRPALTSRELSIVRCAAAGLSAKQTAKELSVSQRTIENMQRVVFLKLGVKNRVECVSRAAQLGLLADQESES